jgi:hypothetical protein
MPFAQNLFDEEGNLKDEKTKQKLIALGKELAEKIKD